MTTARRDPTAPIALILAGLAFAGSVTHVRQTAVDHGQRGWIAWLIAALPEVMVLLAVLRLRRSRRDWWAWLTGASAVGLTVAANLAQAEPTPMGWVMAGWPAWAAVAAAGMVDAGTSATGSATGSATSGATGRRGTPSSSRGATGRGTSATSSATGGDMARGTSATSSASARRGTSATAGDTVDRRRSEVVPRQAGTSATSSATGGATGSATAVSGRTGGTVTAIRGTSATSGATARGTSDTGSATDAGTSATTPSGTSATSGATVDPAEVTAWVAAQRADGRTRADVIREGCSLWGLSVRTMARRWADTDDEEGAA